MGNVSEDLFLLILDLLRREAFLEMKGSSHLLLLFEYDWSTLNEDQRSRLLEALRNSYDRFRDSLSQFVITELLGDYYCDNAAFEVLTDLERTDVEVARALIPHGYEHLVKGASDDSLRKQAMARLLSMKNDPSETVRTEVDEALRHLP